MHEGGRDDLREWCKSVEKPTFIGIDTLALIRPPFRSGQVMYQADYDAMTFLHDLTSEFPGLGIGVVHHNRKMDAEDVFDTVSGTQGLVAAADTVWIIKRNASGTTLHVRGRDVEDSEKAIEFNKTTCRWAILGPAADVHRSHERASVTAVLQDEGGPLNVEDIKNRAGLRTRNAADVLLGKMAKDGEVVRVKRGWYDLPERGGQIGQKERSEAEISDVATENANLSDLSDLSDVSDLAKLQLSASAEAPPLEALDIPAFLKRHEVRTRPINATNGSCPAATDSPSLNSERS